MKFYDLPDTLPGEIKTFDRQIKDYRGGQINPVQFKGIRVAHGIYEQRKENTHMVRIRLAAGGITPKQLRKVAEISKKYGAEEIHITTRTDVQLHYVDLEDVTTVYNELVSVGLSSRGGGGNTVRNIMSSFDSGINPRETFDVAPYAIALTTRMIAEPDSWNLPRKFKMAFSNSDEDTANATITCLGFIAKIKDGKKGFKVYVAGGMGSHPMIGKVLFDFAPEDRVYYIVKAIKIMFDKHGNRRRRNFSKLKFLWDKLGRDEFVRIFSEELAKVEQNPSLALKLVPVENKAEVREGYKPQPPAHQDLFGTWKHRYITAQKQPGLFSVKAPLKLGDLLNDDAVLLANALENFGDNVIRCGLNQNLHIRNIPEAYLGNIFNVLCEIDTLSFGPRVLSNMVACTGAATCKLGICLPRGVTPEIQARLLRSSLDFEAIKDVKVHISGCPNTCGRHHAADLGFFGKVGRSGGDMYPAYNVLVGAVIRDGDPQFAERITEVASKDVPDYVHDVFETFLSKKGRFKSFSDYVRAGEGKQDLIALSERFNKKVPTFARNKDYFFDWGDSEQFSLLKGQKAECSAGVFDMINIDLDTIRQFRLALAAPSIDAAALRDALYKMTFASARMLLVTRGIETTTDEAVFEGFAHHFIGTGIVPERYRPLIDAAKSKNLDDIAAQKTEVLSLCDDMQKLYDSMDDSLRFNMALVQGAGVPSQAQAPAPAPARVAAPAHGNGKPDAFKDFRGVACPLNFVKTKLVLEPMERGKKLEVWLDDGEPVENVPRSVQVEGHKVLHVRKIGPHWSVLIEKV